MVSLHSNIGADADDGDVMGLTSKEDVGIEVSCDMVN